MTHVILRSDRLRLLPLSDEHMDLEYLLDTDPEVMRYVGGPALDRTVVERSHARRMELGRRRDGLGFWVGFAGDLFVGLLMLPPAHGPDQPDDPGVADLGYRLSPPAWGAGYGREAVRLLLTHAFGSVGMRAVLAQTRSDNHRSRRLLDAVGMTHVRDFQSLDAAPGAPLDSEYRLSRKEWRTPPVG